MFHDSYQNFHASTGGKITFEVKKKKKLHSRKMILCATACVIKWAKPCQCSQISNLIFQQTGMRRALIVKGRYKRSAPSRSVLLLLANNK